MVLWVRLTKFMRQEMATSVEVAEEAGVGWPNNPTSVVEVLTTIKVLKCNGIQSNQVNTLLLHSPCLIKAMGKCLNLG